MSLCDKEDCGVLLGAMGFISCGCSMVSEKVAFDCPGLIFVGPGECPNPAEQYGVKSFIVPEGYALVNWRYAKSGDLRLGSLHWRDSREGDVLDLGKYLTKMRLMNGDSTSYPVLRRVPL